MVYIEDGRKSEGGRTAGYRGSYKLEAAISGQSNTREKVPPLAFQGASHILIPRTALNFMLFSQKTFCYISKKCREVLRLGGLLL